MVGCLLPGLCGPSSVCPHSPKGHLPKAARGAGWHLPKAAGSHLPLAAGSALLAFSWGGCREAVIGQLRRCVVYSTYYRWGLERKKSYSNLSAFSERGFAEVAISR